VNCEDCWKLFQCWLPQHVPKVTYLGLYSIPSSVYMAKRVSLVLVYVSLLHVKKHSNRKIWILFKTQNGTAVSLNACSVPVSLYSAQVSLNITDLSDSSLLSIIVNVNPSRHPYPTVIDSYCSAILSSHVLNKPPYQIAPKPPIKI